MSDKDITMKIKMGQKSFKGMKDLDEGRRIDESQIEPICRFVDERFDCADFRALPLLKTLYAYSDHLSNGTIERIKGSLLGFKYWMDEPGDDSMCYWSENHQLLFHTCEYLAGNLFPDEIFTNSNMTGKQHVEKSKWKILQWLLHKWQYGFIEWHSNTYYEEDIAPLAMLIDYSPDDEIAKKASVIMDLLLLDMAMFSYDGYFSSSSGRCYEEGKKSGQKQAIRDIYECAFGDGGYEYDYERLSALFVLCKKYKIPEVLKEIAKDRRTCIIKDSQGLELKELKNEFDMKDKDTGGAFMWQMEAFTNPETVELTLDMFNEYKMQKNDFLKDFRMINYKILRKSKLLPLLVRVLNPSTRGVVIQRSNNYTYKTKDYMLSTSMRHHAGEFGDQQHIWHAVMPGNIHVFTTHPGAPFFDDNARNFSPDYWVGNGIMPDCVQHKNIHMSIYRTNFRKGFLERERLHFSHAYIPEGKFDEIIYREKAFFGRKNDSYIALLSVYPLERKKDEMVQRGKVTAWVCHLSSKNESDSFENFIAKVSKNELKFKDGRTISYNDLELTYKGNFYIDGKKTDSNYDRYDTPYVKAARKPSEMNIRHNDKALKLNFEQMNREESI